jgi:hypothetical protein
MTLLVAITIQILLIIIWLLMVIVKPEQEEK